MVSTGVGKQKGENLVHRAIHTMISVWIQTKIRIMRRRRSCRNELFQSNFTFFETTQHLDAYVGIFDRVLYTLKLTRMLRRVLVRIFFGGLFRRTNIGIT